MKIKDENKWSEEMDKITEALTVMASLGDTITPWVVGVVLGVIASKDKALLTVLFATLTALRNNLSPSSKSAQERVITHPGSAMVN